MRYFAVAVSLLAITRATSAHAQSPRAAVARGDQVRLTTGGDSAAVVGRVVRVDSTQLVVAPPDSGSLPRTIPLANVSHLEIERDVRARSIGAGIGALIGVAAGGSYYYFDICRQNASGCADEKRRASHAAMYDRSYVTVGDVLAIGGLLAGGLLGYALAPAPHWEIVATPGLEPGGDGDSHTALRITVSRTLLGR